MTRRIADLRRLRTELEHLDAAIDEIPTGSTSVCRIIDHVQAGHAGPRRGEHRPALNGRR